MSPMGFPSDSTVALASALVYVLARSGRNGPVSRPQIHRRCEIFSQSLLLVYNGSLTYDQRDVSAEMGSLPLPCYDDKGTG